MEATSHGRRWGQSRIFGRAQTEFSGGFQIHVMHVFDTKFQLSNSSCRNCAFTHL